MEKKGKDKRYLKNWRPISLINVDTKIASKCLASRVKKVLSNLIHSDQTAYVKDRYIGESVRLISDILEYTDSNDIEAILFSADFEKAFDSIDHSFLFAVLESFGFGPDFIQWVRTLFYNAESCVINNGRSTGYFRLERSTRQGDPLLAYLFILALEALLIQIRENNDIKGIIINNTNIKLSAYADDTYFLASDVISLQYIFKTCEIFQQFSSLKLNLDKSHACWIGVAKGKSETPINCHWVNLQMDKIVVLGTYCSYDLLLVEKYNLLNLVSAVNECINMWGCRGLTLAGRILIFKSLALSKVLYTCTMTNFTKDFIKQLEDLRKNFIWNGKRPKIKHSTLIADYVDGGYKDVDIETKLSSLRIIWIRRFLDNSFHAWKAVPYSLLSDIGVTSIFHFNFKPSLFCAQKMTHLPQFYQQMIALWEKTSDKEPEQVFEILNQSIWNNKYILKQDESLFYPFLCKKGISQVKDLMNVDTTTSIFLNWNLAKHKFNLKPNDFMSWLSILEAIPATWKKKLRENQELNTECEEISPSALSVEATYWRLLRPIIEKPTSQETISRFLGITEINWSEVYMTPRRVTIESCLRIFQYNLLNNCVYLNNRISKFDPTISPLCSLCNEVPEEMLHFFCLCSKTQELWNNLRKLLQRYIQLPELTPAVAIIGSWNMEDVNNILCNHIILLFKKFLYANKGSPARLNSVSLKHYIKTVEGIEQKIAYKKDKLKLHLEKWDCIKSVL